MQVVHINSEKTNAIPSILSQACIDPQITQGFREQIPGLEPDLEKKRKMSGCKNGMFPRVWVGFFQVVFFFIINGYTIF